MFIISVLAISLSVFLWRNFYIKDTSSLFVFSILLLLFVFSILLLLFRNRFFVIFLGWEGLGVTSFALIIFYQNWIRIKGGLLTLLTNRIGDAVLIIRFSFIILQRTVYHLFKTASISIIFLLILVSTTKRAQSPFTSWLPAAIAAPTPVRALVHSSTLVTAGIWLLIRFNSLVLISSTLLGLVGFLTLLLASFSALFEKDIKKIVALSTLRQLGLIVFSLSRGGVFLCLFHLLMHAFAKANLFIIVGTFIHNRFSQQDIRNIRRGVEEKSTLLFTFISVLSLRGRVFLSGFFSKDLVLFSSLLLFNSYISLFVYILVISFTLCYCLKIIAFIIYSSSLRVHSKVISRYTGLFSGSTLGMLTLFSGYTFLINYVLVKLPKISNGGILWLFLRLVFVLIRVYSRKWSFLFTIQRVLLSFLTKRGFLFSKILLDVFAILIEKTFLFNNIIVVKQNLIWVRFIFLTTLVCIIIWIF